jgi:hypothetical protein
MQDGFEERRHNEGTGQDQSMLSHKTQTDAE